MTTPTLIKRYPNRRLYDTRESKYITLEDLARMVLEGQEVQVVDARSGDDLTRRVLVQVMLTEDHVHKLDCLPVDFLRTLIQLRDHSMRRLFEHYVSMTLSSFTVAQQAVAKNLELMHQMAPKPADFMSMLNPFGPRKPNGDG